MNNLSVVVSDLASALDEGEIMDVKSNNKANPLKTNKQRNISNNHRKSKLNSAAGGQQKRSGGDNKDNSTDDDDQISPQASMDYVPPLPLKMGLIDVDIDVDLCAGVSGLGADEEEDGSCNCDNTTTNNEEQSGFVDSDNDNITERLCCLSKLSLGGGGPGSGPGGTINPLEGSSTATSAGNVSANGISGGINIPGCSTSSSSVYRRNASYPSLIAESDSFNEVQSKQNASSVFSSSCCPAGGATTGDCASGGPVPPNVGRRFRRRRRRRGHSNSKRMAVDASPVDNNNCCDESMSIGNASSYSIRAAECCGSGSHSSTSKKHLKKLEKSKLPDSMDSFGMKRKRTITMGIGGGGAHGHSGTDDILIHSPIAQGDHIEDQEMKSDDDDEEDSTSGSDEDEEDEDDPGREADDEQSDWVFDEWSNSNSKPSTTEDSSALSRKKRLIKMLRSYTSMISGGVAGVSDQLQLQSREIRAGKRRVFISKPVFPSTGIWTSANEQVSKFLQDPLQSQIRLQPISVEEQVQLSHLASLYSLRMDYCPNREEDQVEEMSKPEDEEIDLSLDLKLCPVLTKTPNTTQMDKNSNDPQMALSPFNGEGSSSSNLSSVYCPTYSDLDSKTSESKRIKK